MKVLAQTSPTHSEILFSVTSSGTAKLKELTNFHCCPPPIVARPLRQATCWSDPCVSCACDVLPRQPGEVIVVINPSSITCTPSTAPKKGASQTKGPLPVALSGASLCKLPMLKQGWICSTFKRRHVLLSHHVSSHNSRTEKKPLKTASPKLVSTSFIHVTLRKKGSVVTLCICFQCSNGGYSKLYLKPQISRNFSDLKHLLVVPNPPVSQNRLVVPSQKRLLKKNKTVILSKRCFYHSANGSKNAKTQELLETWGNQLNQHLLKALSWYTSANVMHLEYSYSCINLSKKTPIPGNIFCFKNSVIIC